MITGLLSDYFEGAAVKTLSVVDATPSVSNQHEIGTTKAMREQFLGTEKRQFAAKYIWIDEGDQAITEDGFATHYDSRENKPKRAAEWRLYYPGNAVTDLMKAGDTLFIAKRKNEDLIVFVVASPSSTAERQMLWLFGLQRPQDKFSSNEYSSKDGTDIGFAGHLILEELGIEREDRNADDLDKLVARFGLEFPVTAEFSALARQTAPSVDPVDDPDGALIAWLDHEEAMFRRLERKIIQFRIEAGFSDKDGADIDGFLRFSLSVQNRRKSRMGFSFEHHLAALFNAFNIRYAKGVFTEGRQKPDFLFPDLAAYHSLESGNVALMMLAVKSTCKDRWRQILSEADKVPRKHLATLEPSISEAQTSQMGGKLVQLVVPKSIHRTYSVDQQKWLWSVRDFVRAVLKSQQ